MKSLIKREQVNMNPKLISAVLKQLGLTFKKFVEEIKTFPEIYGNAYYGIQGFIYYHETHKFAMENQSLIVDQLEKDSKDLDMDIIEIVKHFSVFRKNGKNGIEDKDKYELFSFIGGNKETKQSIITHILAGYCVEALNYHVLETLRSN